MTRDDLRAHMFRVFNVARAVSLLRAPWALCEATGDRVRGSWVYDDARPDVVSIKDADGVMWDVVGISARFVIGGADALPCGYTPTHLIVARKEHAQ